MPADHAFTSGSQAFSPGSRTASRPIRDDDPSRPLGGRSLLTAGEADRNPRNDEADRNPRSDEADRNSRSDGADRNLSNEVDVCA
ncbi:hypothetical protein [Halorubrum yunnanense]|uniref:Uncharacterized protein n=1 Tax=Halorubrum yunnanense TaxID=1526162 RepID=A0ABD5YEA4_9EURY|nr:hypothetical protein [Halorubrum yunnanense]